MSNATISPVNGEEATMKKMFIALSASSVLLTALPAQAISVQEIITLARIGVSGDEMIKAIDRDRTVFNLTVNEILELKKAGITEEVLKYMLKTPQTYGGASAVKPQNEPPPVQEMTPEEKAALEAKQREEAQRLAGEAAKAEESQRRAFADGILKKGMDLARRENCVGAIQTFLDFITQGGYQRGSDEYYTAWYGIAHALNQCELFQSSANYLVDVLLEGPEKPFFQQAFWELRALRKQINYSPPDLEKLTEFSVTNFSRRFQDEFNYFLGEFFYDYNNFTKALDFFAAVSTDAPEYPRALYLTGLVQTQNNLYKSAVENFQRAINATEILDDVDPEVRTLSYLALARIAYEAENFDAAVYYYRKVPTDSPKLATAFYESAWTFLLKGDYERALGTFQALHSPYFQHYFYPELWILEATIYVNLCYVERAEQAIKQFDERVSALSIPLKKMVRAFRASPVSHICAREEPDVEDRKRRGVVVLDNANRVIEFQEKPEQPRSQWVALPIYLFPASVLPLIPTYLREGRSADAPGSFVEWLCRMEPVYAHKIDGTVLDIGNPESLEKAREKMRDEG